jgi:hypothetical protein
MFDELQVVDAIDAGCGDVELPSGRGDLAERLGEVSAGTDAGRDPIGLGDLVEDLVRAGRPTRSETHCPFGLDGLTVLAQ